MISRNKKPAQSYTDFRSGEGWGSSKQGSPDRTAFSASPGKTTITFEQSNGSLSNPFGKSVDKMDEDERKKAIKRRLKRLKAR